MALNLGSRIKNIYNGLTSYAKEHPWKTALAVAAGAFGLLLIAGGIVLTITAPATYGGGAAVGIPLLGVGVGLAAGVVVIAAGVVTTGCATGYLWSSAKTHNRRQALLNIDEGTTLRVKKSVGKQKPSKSADKKEVRFAVVPVDVLEGEEKKAVRRRKTASKAESSPKKSSWKGKF